MNNISYSIIIMVTVVGVVGSALIALAVYLIDKNADRHDEHN